MDAQNYQIERNYVFLQTNINGLPRTNKDCH